MHSYTLRAQRDSLIGVFLAEQKRQREDFDAKLASLDEQITQVEQQEMKAISDPQVLVRSSLGARRKVYHRAGNPCGRTAYNGGRSEGFRRMPESEAKQMDGGILKRCSACWNY